MVGAAAAAGLTMSACAPTHAGAAATIGGQRITDNQVAAAANTQLADDNTKDTAKNDKALKRTVLTQLIKDRLIADAASDKGVSVSAGDVQKEIVKDGGKQAILNSLAANAHAVAEADFHNFMYYYVLQNKLGAALVANGTVQAAELRIAQTSDQSSAEQLAAAAKQDPSDFDSHASTTTLPLQLLPEPLKSDLAQKSAGDIFAEEIQGSAYVVQLVSLRSVDASALDSQTAQEYQGYVVTSYLNKLSQDRGVSVSPRYGKWDPSTESVVASTGALSSPAPTSAAIVPSAPPSAPPSPAAG